MINHKLLLNAICEFGPIFGFIIAFEITDNFNIAVIVMMIATVLSLYFLRHLEHHIPKFALISAGSVLLFGCISLFEDVPDLYILRDTVFDIILGVILIVSVIIKKPFFKYIFNKVFAITDRGWTLLSLRWGIFYLLLAICNEYVRQTMSEETWVFSKIILIIFTVIFGFYQLTLTKCERLPHATKWGILNE